MRYLSLAHVNDAFKSPIQDAQNLFLRLLSGAHAHTSRWKLHKNVGLELVQTELYKAAARLWNALHTDPLLTKALESDVALHLKGNRLSWSAHVLPRAVHLGGLPGVQARELHSLTALDILSTPMRDTLLFRGLESHYERMWKVECEGSPYLDLHTATTHSARRFQDCVLSAGTFHHVRLHASVHLIDTLFRFRVGAAGLRAGVHSHNAVDRHCKLCTMSVVEDELHVVQHCPAYAPVRSRPQFSGLFRVLLHEGIQAFLNVEDQHSLACCLSQLLQFSRYLMATA